MNRRELKNLLQAERFNPRLYSLDGGIRDNTLCITRVWFRWCYYFTERGERFDEQWFDSEDEACQYLLSQLRSLPEYHTRLPEPPRS